MTTKTSSATNTAAFRDELKHDAARLKDTIGDRAKTEATTRIDQASQAMGSASNAFEAAADNLDSNPDAPDWLASAIQRAARKLDGLASQLSGRSFEDIGHEVSQFARQNPGTFLAGSAAAGFAAARVLRAGMDKKRHDQPDEAGSDHQSANHSNPAEDMASDAGSVSSTGIPQQDSQGIAS